MTGNYSAERRLCDEQPLYLEFIAVTELHFCISWSACRCSPHGFNTKSSYQLSKHWIIPLDFVYLFGGRVSLPMKAKRVLSVVCLFVSVLAETIQISCQTPGGQLPHYYHFLVDCLVPSILFKLQHPKKSIELCNADKLKDHHNNLQGLYQKVLPDVVLLPACDKKGSAIVLDRYDAHHGSEILRLRESDRLSIANYFRSISPPLIKQKYINLSRSGFRVVVIDRASDPNANALPNNEKTGADRRSISNMKELEYTLTKSFGALTVNIVHLERMDIFEQFWVFHTANIVIGQHGAGLSNLIFTNPVRFVGMIEISCYVADPHSKQYRIFSECFQYIARAVNTRYIRIAQHGGEFGHVNVSEVVRGVYQLNNTIFWKEERVADQPQTFDTTDEDGDNRTVVNDNDVHNTGNSLLVTVTHAHLKCVMHTGDESLEYFFNCLAPVVIFVVNHPQVQSVGVCGILGSARYMDMFLRNVLGPLFAGTSQGCELGVLPIRHYWNEGDMQMTMIEKTKIRRYFATHSNNATNIVNVSMSPLSQHDLVVINSTRLRHISKEPEDVQSRNFEEMVAALRIVYHDRVAVVNILSLSMLKRAAVFSNVKNCVLVHQGPTLFNALFLQNSSKVIEIVPNRAASGSQEDKYDLVMRKMQVSAIPIEQNEDGQIDINLVVKIVKTSCMEL